MSSLFPKGLFTRSRVDWALDGLMVGSGNQVFAYPNRPAVALHNNSPNGFKLAIYAVTAYVSKGPNLCTGQIGQPTVQNNSSQLQPLVAGGAAIEGIIQQANAANLGGFTGTWLFRGDGSTRYGQDGAPIAVIQVGQTFCVTPQLFLPELGAAYNLTVEFIWGRYE